MTGFDHYHVLRDRMMTGDLVETAMDTGIPSPIIRFVTGEDVSHSAMILRLTGFNPGDDLFVLEAWNDGIRLRRMSVLVAQCDHVFWHPLVGVDAEIRARAAGWMLARVGADPDGRYAYGWFDALRAGMGIEPMDETRLICSECVAFAWHSGGAIETLPDRCPVPGKLDELGCTLPAVAVKRRWA